MYKRQGCGPIRTFFIVIIPMLKPTLISVGILEIMWIWNDYLLPYLVLDLDQYRTIPIHIQYLQGSYGSVDLGAIMALIILSIIPVIFFYLTCQKYIIKGVAAVSYTHLDVYKRQLVYGFVCNSIPIYNKCVSFLNSIFINIGD